MRINKKILFLEFFAVKSFYSRNLNTKLLIDGTVIFLSRAAEFFNYK